MAFNVKKRGRLTYYYGGDHPTLSALVTEQLDGGDLKIYFAGLTGGHSAKGVLERDELVRMEPSAASATTCPTPVCPPDLRCT